MLRVILLMTFVPFGLSTWASLAALQKTSWHGGVVILDNCDPKFNGKAEYNDNLTVVNAAGKTTFRVTGFNNCETIGSSRMIVADPIRQCIWAIENVAHRIRRFELAGNETLTIPGVDGGHRRRPRNR